MWNLLYQIQSSVAAIVSRLTELKFNVNVIEAKVNALAGVTKLVAGSRVTLSPSTGLGDVTITAAISPVTQLTAGANVTVSGGGLGNVTITAANAPVTSLIAGSRITLTNGGIGNVTITAAAAPVLALVAGTNISVTNGGLGTVTIAAANAPVTALIAGTNISVTNGGLGNVSISAAGHALKYYEGDLRAFPTGIGYKVYPWSTGFTKLLSWRLVLVCQVTDPGVFVAGEEYDIEYIFSTEVSAQVKFTPSTGVALVGCSWLNANNTQPHLVRIDVDGSGATTNFDYTTITMANWRFKFYAVGL